MVCACLVVACLRSIPKIAETSLDTNEMKADPLSVISVDGRYAGRHMISTSALATLDAFGLDSEKRRSP